MKVKILGSLFIVFIIYLIAVLIGLIQFKPLSEILIMSVKISSLSFFILIIINQFMEKISIKKETELINNKNNKQKEKKQDNTDQKFEKTENDGVDNEIIGEQEKNDFNEMEPPVIEYEEK